MLCHQDASRLMLFVITPLTLILTHLDDITNDHRLMLKFIDMIYMIVTFNPMIDFGEKSVT